MNSTCFYYSVMPFSSVQVRKEPGIVSQPPKKIQISQISLRSSPQLRVAIESWPYWGMKMGLAILPPPNRYLEWPKSNPENSDPYSEPKKR